MSCYMKSPALVVCTLHLHTLWTTKQPTYPRADHTSGLPFFVHTVAWLQLHPIAATTGFLPHYLRTPLIIVQDLNLTQLKRSLSIFKVSISDQLDDGVCPCDSRIHRHKDIHYTLLYEIPN